MTRLHATCVALADDSHGWRGVLLRGGSGTGKSDLALRLIDAGARLVADDQTEIRPASGALVARAPPALAGRLEVRGVGIVALPALEAVDLCLICDLVRPAEVPRLPEPEHATIEGIALARLRIAPFESAAVAKVRLGVDAAARGILGLSD